MDNKLNIPLVEKNLIDAIKIFEIFGFAGAIGITIYGLILFSYLFFVGISLAFFTFLFSALMKTLLSILMLLKKIAERE